MLRNVLFVRKFVEKAHESSFPLGNEIQVAQPVHGGPRGTKWGLHNLYFDWASSSRATDNVGYIAVIGRFKKKKRKIKKRKKKRGFLRNHPQISPWTVLGESAFFSSNHHMLYPY